MVAQISALRKIKFELSAEPVDGDDATIYLENSDNFVGNGKIIELVSIKSNKIKW